MPIKNRFAELLLDKSAKEKKRITIKEVSGKLNLHPHTLEAWYSNKTTRFDAETIEKLIKYFTCKVGDLLVYEDDKETE